MQRIFMKFPTRETERTNKPKIGSGSGVKRAYAETCFGQPLTQATRNTLTPGTGQDKRTAPSALVASDGNAKPQALARATPDEALWGVGEASFPTGDATSGGAKPQERRIFARISGKIHFFGISVRVLPAKFAENTSHLLCAAL